MVSQLEVTAALNRALRNGAIQFRTLVRAIVPDDPKEQEEIFASFARHQDIGERNYVNIFPDGDSFVDIRRNWGKPGKQLEIAKKGSGQEPQAISRILESHLGKIEHELRKYLHARRPAAHALAGAT